MSLSIEWKLAVHRHRTGVGSIPAGGPIVDEFFSTVSQQKSWEMTQCLILKAWSNEDES